MLASTLKRTLFILALSLPLAGWADQSLKTFTIEFESERLLHRGDAVLTHTDVDGFLHERVPEEDRVPMLSNPDRIAELLNGLLLAESFVPLAREAGLLDDELIQARLYRTLAVEIRRVYREHFLAEVERESYESSAREFYLTRGREFMHPDTVDFEHILVGVGQGRSEVDAMKRIVDLHERLNSGEEFSVLASQYSDDPSVRENNGLMTGVVPSSLVAQVASTLAETPVGTYSDPIRSRFGWHVVRLIEVHPGEQMTWEEARERAENIARDRHMTQAWERLLRDVQDAPVEFAEGAIARLLQRHNAATAGDDSGHSESVQRLLEDG